MGHIQDIERELIPMLHALDEEHRKGVAKWVKDKVLESFKNGLKAGKEKSESPRQEKRNYQK